MTDGDRSTREHLRRLFWDGDGIDTGPAARALRALVGDGRVPVEETGVVVPVVYEAGGTARLEQVLESVRQGSRRVWDWVTSRGSRETEATHPYLMEFDLAGAIYFRELVEVRPDGGPLDPAAHFARQAADFPTFVGQPVDAAATSAFTWPTAVLSGGRDMRTVRPDAHRLAESLPDGVLVPLEDSAHSFLDFHPRVALLAAAATTKASHHRLPDLAERMDGLRRPPQARMLDTLLAARLTEDRVRRSVLRR